MTLMSSISRLTTSVDQLAGEANVTKAQLYAKAAQADAEVVATQVEQAATEVARGEAAAHATDAAIHLATVKADVTYQGIGAILSEKAVTAVEVFVYDTSLDSDGGAWRKRCQHTSWYNEPLNTATRGTRREFPAVAMIVCVGNQLLIYDGDDPTLPMWMIFQASVNLNMLGSGGAGRAEALNGTVVVVGSGSFGNHYAFHFLRDEGGRHTASNTFGKTYSGNIAERNAGKGFNGVPMALIRGEPSRDVSLIVLADAPIDPATGLPIPTIFAATNAGVSVIRHDGTVANSAQTGNSLRVEATKDALWYGIETALYVATWDQIAAGSGFGVLAAVNFGPTPITSPVRFHQFSVGDDFLAAGSGTAINGTVQGFAKFRGSASTMGTSMLALVTSRYNTGLLPGAIRGAFLSDTDDTDLIGSGELVTNGTFDTDTDWWNANDGASLSVVSGRLRITCDVSYRYAYQVLNTQVGKTYNLMLDGFVGTTSFDVFLGTSIGAGTLGTSGTRSTEGLVGISFTATSSTTFLHLRARNETNSSDVYVEFDNISVRLADTDRSVAKKGLTINGTITRAPIAPGAELVAYSGFSAVNYLEQPYNPALDFGTGDFCYMGWVNYAGSNQRSIFVRQDPVTGFYVTILRANNLSVSFTFNNGLGGLSTAAGTLALGWSFVTALRKNGVVQIYINGRFVQSALYTGDVSRSGAHLTVGAWIYPGAPQAFGDPLALLRISATAPTPDQIRKIYEDERKLFMPGAQCTLFGTSDAVTALAHDPKTNLLHVGTSQGRSVFDGLVRVANTETPVTTAISAVGGMIAEQ